MNKLKRRLQDNQNTEKSKFTKGIGLLSTNGATYINLGCES